MNKKIGWVAFLLLICLGVQAQVVLKQGMTITKSVKISRRTYLLNGFDSLNKAVLVIKGNNITVDFNQAVLKGSNKKAPNEFYGIAILIGGGKNITIKNLSAKGYKVALMARNVEGLKIEDCDFSYNYRPHLNSTQENEDISDWMSYHKNEADEWLRYGAAIYLRGCNNAIISGNKVTGGQNALMMTACNGATIYNNDFSFNSGIGMGFYRSSFNKVLHNRVNFNVRGYSHGVYTRGQDSAGFLVYEQSSGNLFYKNSATHSGDGFFLWAGQTTMDTGQGGCNDNQILYNDFSYAPTNGIEVTFSRNSIGHNRIFECDHGIWGGYSYQTAIADNQFRFNRIAIAIEHGQENEITGNVFIRNREAIKLWARAAQPANWGYAKFRDTRSVGTVIGANNFSRNGTVFNLQRTDSLYVFDNIVTGNETLYKIDSTVTNLDSTPRLLYDTATTDHSFPGGMDAFKGNGQLAGRHNIRMTEWGPYDFRYPLLWQNNPTDTGSQVVLDVLGPKGKWRILSVKGVGAYRASADSFPATVRFTKGTGEKQDIEIVAEFRGPAFTDAFGKKIGANKPYRFHFQKFFQPVAFTVNWYAWDSTGTMENEILSLNNRQPIKTEKTTKLDYAWWGGLKTADSSYQQFLTVAEGTAVFTKGIYEFSVTWDDAVRVYVDGKKVINQWKQGQQTFDEAPNKKHRVNLSGKHTIRVEHAELGGFATLSLKIVKADRR